MADGSVEIQSPIGNILTYHTGSVSRDRGTAIIISKYSYRYIIVTEGKTDNESVKRSAIK